VSVPLADGCFAGSAEIAKSVSVPLAHGCFAGSAEIAKSVSVPLADGCFAGSAEIAKSVSVPLYLRGTGKIGNVPFSPFQEAHLDEDFSGRLDELAARAADIRGYL
jgi:hypothetical protein